MKISYQWLKKYLPNLPSPEKVACLLTQAGLEVNKITPFEFLNAKLLIGQVLTCSKHPHADKLKKTTVDVGTATPLQIICGANNVATGQKVIVAPVGTTFTSAEGKTLKIKKVKIRGEASEGMICSEEEIGLAKTQEGILELTTKHPAGTPAHVHFGTLPDTLLDIELTPNRADAFSHIGIARELAVLLQKNLEEPIIEPLVATHTLSFQVVVEDILACPRYTGIILQNIQVAPSPIWLQNALKAINIHPINNVVDVTNFVMHELGQPLHAFDYDSLSSKKIIVKKLPKKTSFTTLEGITRTLSGDELMICDKKGPIAMAGIIGGGKSKILPTTKNILLESAYFEPTIIAKASRYHKLHTEASFRFERGTDPNLPRTALQRASNLLQKITQATIASDIVEHYPHPIQPTHINITYAYIHKLIGISLSPELIHNLLEKLDIKIQTTTEKDFTAIVPPYRVDVKRPADLIEEILRIYGYNKLAKAKAPSQTYIMPALPDEKKIDQTHHIITLLAAQGYHQIITNPLTKSTYLEKSLESKKAVYLQNPIAEHLDSLRQTLLFSGLEVIAHNLHHGQTTLKLFELGKIYHQQQEYQRIGIWLAGDVEAPNWIRKNRKITLQDLYATVYLLLQQSGITDWQSLPIQHNLYQECLDVKAGQTTLLNMGLVHPSILQPLDIQEKVFFAEIDTLALLQHKNVKKLYTPIPKYPTITRDLSLAIDKQITFEQIHTLIKKQNLPQVQTFYLIDTYTGTNIEKNKKSYTLRFILQDPHKTLKDHHANQIIDQLMQVLHLELGATMRE